MITASWGKFFHSKKKLYHLVDFLDHNAHGQPEVIAFALLDFSLEALRTAPFHKQTFDFPSDREDTFKEK